MSIAMMTAVWTLDLPDSEKLVLLALADSANDNGKCWPSMASLTRKCSKGERTVQGVIKKLVDRRLLARLEKPGKGVIYRVYPEGDAPDVATHAAAAPRKDCAPQPLRPADVAGTPAATADKPSMNLSPPVRAKALPTPEGGSGPADPVSGKRQKGSAPAAEPKKRAAGSRLSADWQPQPIDDLPQPVLTIVRQWPAGAYELVAVMFRNHWQAEGRAIGAKRDWGATWHNWLLRESTSILRAAKAGQRFDGTATGPAVKATREEQAARAALADRKGEESEALGNLRRALRAAIGARAYDGWIKASAMAIDGNSLVITSPSAFIGSYAQQHFAIALQEAAIATLGGEIELRFETVRPPGDVERKAA